MTLKEKLDDMYEREEWNPEWVAQIGIALEIIESPSVTYQSVLKRKLSKALEG